MIENKMKKCVRVRHVVKQNPFVWRKKTTLWRCAIVANSETKRLYHFAFENHQNKLAQHISLVSIQIHTIMASLWFIIYEQKKKYI